MNELGLLGHELLVRPIINLLVAFYNFFTFLNFPGALGLSIIALTLLIRFLLNPLTASQLKSAQKMQELKPKMDEINKKYGKDKVALQGAQMRLYKEAGINPASGCFLLLLQMPVLIALYNVFLTVLAEGKITTIIENLNKVVYFPFLKIQSLDFSFLGMSLVAKPSDFKQMGWWLLLIPVVTAILQWYQTKLMTPNPPLDLEVAKKTKTKDDDTAAIMQKQMGIMLPLLIGWFAFSFPVGLSLYWNTFSILGILQQRRIQNIKVTPHDEKKIWKTLN